MIRSMAWVAMMISLAVRVMIISSLASGQVTSTEALAMTSFLSAIPILLQFWRYLALLEFLGVRKFVLTQRPRSSPPLCWGGLGRPIEIAKLLTVPSQFGRAHAAFRADGGAGNPGNAGGGALPVRPCPARCAQLRDNSTIHRIGQPASTGFYNEKKDQTPWQPHSAKNANYSATTPSP